MSPKASGNRFLAGAGKVSQSLPTVTCISVCATQLDFRVKKVEEKTTTPPGPLKPTRVEES